MADLDIFLVGLPGLEDALTAEAVERGFTGAKQVRGGVEVTGDWAEVWRANRELRGASRVLVRLGSFKAKGLGQLEAEARTFRWLDHLAPREPVRLDITCRKSRVNHAGAAAQKIERALRSAQIPVVPTADLTLKIRIDHDLCGISADTSGAPLHKRGHKEAVSKAPLRETMAALFLRRCGWTPGMTVVDPFCGSGTIPIEAAEISAGLIPGRSRSFAFETLPSFNPAQYSMLGNTLGTPTPGRFIGYDKDQGAIRSATQNAARAGVDCDFACQPVAELTVPEGPPGLVLCNPPYGARIGSPKALTGLYETLGARLKDGFKGWKVGVVTSEESLARATGLPFGAKGPPIAHGGLKVWLFQTKPL
ncbi:MAG: class I SAM-dependent RNA methyltransferase [Pseudomonadota bacterium]